MECIIQPSINCCEGGKCKDSYCPSTHSCCWQDPKNGSSATLGICVKKDDKGNNKNCDFERGLPVKNCKDKTNKFKPEKISKSIDYIKKREGYNDQCIYSLPSCYLIFLLVLFLAIAFSVIIINCQNKK